MLTDVQEGSLRSLCMLFSSTPFPLWQVPAYVFEAPARLLAICQPISVIFCLYVFACVFICMYAYTCEGHKVSVQCQTLKAVSVEKGENYNFDSFELKLNVKMSSYLKWICQNSQREFGPHHSYLNGLWTAKSLGSFENPKFKGYFLVLATRLSATDTLLRNWHREPSI